MADLTDNLVQRYEVIPANQDVGDRFDQNNFYPMDGENDYDEDSEFYENFQDDEEDYEDYEDFYEDFLGDDEDFEDFDDDEDAELSFDEDEDLYDSFDDDEEDGGSLEDYEFFGDDDDFSEARGGRWKAKRAKRKAKRQARRGKMKAKRQQRKAKRKAIRKMPKGERKQARKNWMQERRAKRKARQQKRRSMSPQQRKAMRKKRMKRFGTGAKKVAGYYPPVALARLARKQWRKRKKSNMNGIDEYEGEYSELFGIKSKKKGGEGIFKGLGRLFKKNKENIKTKDTQAGVDRLGERLTRRGEKAKFRQQRRKMRQDARQMRKMGSIPPETKMQTKEVADSNAVIKSAVIKTAKGIAPKVEEVIAEKTVQVANKILGKEGAKLDVGAVKEELKDVVDVATADATLDELLDDANPKGQTGWKGLSTGAKIGIVGGSIVVACIVGYFIIKGAKGRKSTTSKT